MFIVGIIFISILTYVIIAVTGYRLHMYQLYLKSDYRDEPFEDYDIMCDCDTDWDEDNMLGFWMFWPIAFPAYLIIKLIMIITKSIFNTIFNILTKE